MGAGRTETLEDGFQLALKKEEDTYVFYQQCSEGVRSLSVQAFLGEMALTEKAHKVLLEQARQDKRMDCLISRKGQVVNFCDLLAEVDFDEGLSLQEAVILAMKNEKKTVCFYHELTGACSGTPPEEIFICMVNIKLNHLEQLELGYEEIFLQGM
jgi:rubrerythrin